MPSSARILLATIGGGLVIGLLWLTVNLSHRGAGGGWLEQQPWPLSSLYACAAVGAALSLLQALVQARRQGRLNEDLAGVAARLGMAYRAEASPAELAGGAQLQIFSRWHRGWNRLYGRFEGLDVQMLDFTAAEPAGSRIAQATAGSQTVVLVRVRNASWPIFRIYPRGIATLLWGLLGCRGIRFRFREHNLVTGAEREVLRRFNRRYHVFIGASARIAELAGLDTGLPLGESPLETREIADRFSLSTLRHFAASHGWNVESCGTHAAFWRSGRVLPASRREAFLSEVTVLYRSLDQPARSPADANVEVELEQPDTLQLGRRAVGLICGAAVGMLLAMLVGFPVLRVLPFEIASWLVLLWPLLCIAAMAAGAYLGARLAATTRPGP